MSETQTLQVEQGWYDDPTGPEFERWWTGSIWTETRRMSTTMVPPEPSPVPTIIPGIALCDLAHEKMGILYAPPVQAASVKRRLAARALDDLMITGIPVTVVTVLNHFGVSLFGSWGSNRAIMLGLVLWIVNHVLFVAAFGTTAGKRLVHLEIVDHRGRKPSLWLTALRLTSQTLVCGTLALPFAIIPIESERWTDDLARIGAMFLGLFVLAIPVLLTGRTAWDRVTRTTVVEA
jgi:uncharacterized RDD family membrane protein YckC